MNRKKLQLRGSWKRLAACFLFLANFSLLDAQTPVASSGQDFTVVIDEGNNLYTFGNNSSGQLGVEDAGSLSADPLLVEPSGVWLHASASKGTGSVHVLAVRTDGTVWAWGSNNRGQLGNGTTDSSPIPVQVAGLTNCVEVAAGAEFSMARTNTGQIFVWGDNSYGQLAWEIQDQQNNGIGIPNSLDNIYSTPIPLGDGSEYAPAEPGDGNTYISIAVGLTHGLGIRTDGTLHSWGYSSRSQLGQGSGINVIRGPLVSPTQIGSNDTWATVYSGERICFGIRENGQLFVWGNSGAQDGLGPSADYTDTPTLVNHDTDWASVAIGFDHVLALKTNGDLYGWGRNPSGQLGIPIRDGAGEPIFANNPVDLPRQLEDGTTFLAVSAGTSFSTAYTSDSLLLSTGIDTVGQRGDGSVNGANQYDFKNSGLGVADLTITSVIVTTTDIVLANPLNATVTVKNRGTGTIEDDIELAAVLSPTTNFDDLTAIPLTVSSGQPITDDLAPGASIATNLELELPAVVNAGTYFLVVRVDPNNTIEETTEDNNDAADISDGDDEGEEPDGLLFQADLQIVSTDIIVTPAGPFEVGDSIDIEVTITNEDIGTIPANPDGSFALRYVLSQVADIADITVVDLLTDDLLTPDTDESVILVTDEVPAGGSVVIDLSFVLPDALGVGDFYAGLVVDVNDDIDESNEDNNLAFTETALIEVQGLELGEALDNLDLDFVTDGDGVWYGSAASVFGPGGEHAAIDDDAAVSPPIGGGQSAYISTTLDETSLITFRWKANTSSPSNRLIYRYLGAEVGSGENEISGISGDWIEVQRIAPGGVQIIWQYIEDVDAPSDEVYLDNVQIAAIADDPDFIIDDVELVADTEGNSGSYVLGRDELDLAIFIRNQASDYYAALDGLADVRVYLSQDGNFNPASDRLIHTFTYSAVDAILSGNSSIIQPSITLPTDLEDGDYRLIVVVDEDDNVTEILEDNNIFISEEADIEIIALPDFTITEMNPEPGFYLVGDNLDFELTLQNNGLQPEFDPITVRIVFSTDNIFSDDDYVFGDFEYTGGLAAAGLPGSTNTYSPDIAQIRADVSPIADFLYFGVIIDPDDVHPELNENDNATFYDLPDFIFGQVSIDEAMEFDELGLSAVNKELPSFSGSDNRFNNPFVGQVGESASGIGGDAAQSSDIEDGESATFSVTFTTDTDTIISFDWRTSSEFTLVDGGIKADWLIVYVDDAEVGRIAGQLDWAKFTQSVTAGTHTVRWEYQKDSSDAEGQDTAWVDNFQYRLPDLEVSNIQIATQSVNPGDVVNVSFTVTNVGEDPVPATPSYSVDARFSPDNQWGGNGDVELQITPDPVNPGELQPGEDVDFAGTITVPAGFAEEGDFFFGLRVDPDPDNADDAVNGPGLVLETDEANNTLFTETAVITVSPFVTLNEALDIDGLIPEPVLTNGGNAAWFGLDNVDVSDLPPGAVDDDIARSGSVDLGETSYFETQFTGPKVLKYRWKVDSASSNTLEVAVNGEVVESISGRVDWDFGFGPFTITYDGETTVALRSEATATEVENALNALTSISDAGGVTVTGPLLIAAANRFIYEFEFGNDGDQQGQMLFNALDENRLIGSTLTTSQNGSPDVNEIRRLVIEPNIFFTLTYAGQTTDQIPYYATAADVQVALNALGTITADGGVTVADHPEAESALDFLVTFNAFGERELIIVNPTGLRQPVTIEAELNSDRFKPSGSEGVEGDVGTAQIQPLRVGPEITVFVPAGPGAQIVRWTYRKNSNAGDFQDAGWLDQLRILDFAEPELVLTDLNYVAGTYVLDVTAIAGAPDQKLGTEVLDITVQAQNQGLDLDPSLGAFTSADLEVRLSTDRIYGNVDDIVLGSFTQVEGTLASGQFMSFLGGLPLGDHIPEDDYYLIVKVDANDRVDEFSTSNNIVISQNPDVRVERKPRLLIYDGLGDPNIRSSFEAFYVDAVDYDEAKLYYPEAPMRLTMEIQNIGLDDLFDENGRLLNWRVNYRLGFVDRADLSDALPGPLVTDDFEGTVTGYLDLGSTTIAEAMEGRRLSAPDGDRVLLDIEYTLPTPGRMLQIVAEGNGITDYIYFIQIVVDADDTVDESGIVNVWNNVDLVDLQNTTIPTTDVDDGLFSIFGAAPSNATDWGSVYGVIADADSLNPDEVDNFLAYAFNRNPGAGDTAGGQFPGTYGVDTLELEDYLTVTFDIITVSSDLAYIVEASNGVDFAPANLVSSLNIEPPYDSLVGSRSLTGEGGLIDQQGDDGGAPGDPGRIEVVSVVDEGYSARVTLRYPTTVADTLSGFMRIRVESRPVEANLSPLEIFVRDEMDALGVSDLADAAPDFDFDNDGVSNLIELMYGSDPTLIGDVPALSDPEDTFVAEQLADMDIYAVGLTDIGAADDFDGDATSNLVEIVAGTDPNDDTDEPTAVEEFVAEGLIANGVLDTFNTGPDDDYDSDGVSNLVELLDGLNPNDNGDTPTLSALEQFVASEMGKLGALGSGIVGIGPDDDFDLDTFTNVEELILGSDPTDDGSIPTLDADPTLAAIQLFVANGLANDGVFEVGPANVSPDADFDADGVSNLVELMYGTNTNDNGETPILSALEVSVAEDMAPFIEDFVGLTVGLSDIGPFDNFDGAGADNYTELLNGTDPADPTDP